MWQILACIGFLFLLLEMFTPGMFFLNFALSAFVCAILSLYTQSITILTIVFCALGLILIFTLRPILMKNFKSKNLQTGMESKYVGKTALAVEDIDKNKGIITLYDERWQARNIEEGTISKGENVEIVGYESIIMYVKKI